MAQNGKDDSSDVAAEDLPIINSAVIDGALRRPVLRWTRCALWAWITL